MLLARSQPGDDHTAGCLLAQSQAAARALDLAGIERRVAALLAAGAR
ncbi:MAG TPA: hypothetical protein VJ622_11905 [Acidimicrobiia bacterium]|nr:hypothetical protein [Acidimicrobiia bacterium]HKN90977.1 hypothetical protein [Acidimicrobiia bacterium]